METFHPIAALTRRKELETLIVARAWEDEAFREALLQDAPQALKSLDLPDTLLANIEIVPEPVGRLLIVLPSRPGISQELSDTDLQDISGGDARQSVAYMEHMWDFFGEASAQIRKWWDSNIHKPVMDLIKIDKLIGNSKEKE